MSGKSSPGSNSSGTDVSPSPDCPITSLSHPRVWSTDGQGPMLHWLLFELYSKYDPENLHRKLDGLIFRVLTLAFDTAPPSDKDAIVLLRKESGEGQYLLCVGREEPWQSVLPEDGIMTAIQSAGLATARYLGTTVSRKGVISDGLSVDDLLTEGELWKKAQAQGHA